MKNLSLLALGTTLLFTLAFCKNTPLPEGQTMVSDNMPTENPTAGAPLPASKADSLVGFKGCDKATWSPLSTDSEEFVYQHYTVKITRNAKRPGQQITVVRDSNRTDFVIPMPNIGHFKGVSRNKLFVDADNGPEGHELLVFDLDRKLQFFNITYCGEPLIYQHEKIYFLIPVEEKDVAKMPDCPEREEWEKKDLEVGYGQRAIFNFMVRSLTKKSEWACVAKQ